MRAVTAAFREDPTFRGAVRLLVVFVTLVLLGGTCAAARISGPGGPTIIFDEDDARAAEQVFDHVALRWPQVADEFGVARDPWPTVVVAASAESFSDLVSGGVPDWGVGCAFVERGVISLKSPRIVDYPLEMDQVIVHELTHLAAGRALRGVPVPRWFHEGIAMTVAGEWRMEQSSALAAAASSGRTIPLGELADRFPEDSGRAMLAYVESFRAVAFMAERSGIERPGALAGAVAAEGDFGRALARLTGLESGEFALALDERLGRRFGLELLLQRPTVYFLALTVLFLAAVVIRVRRARSKMRLWEAEENSAAGEQVGRGSRGGWE